MFSSLAVIIILLAILVVNLDKILPKPNISFNTPKKNTQSSGTPMVDASTCVGKYGVSEGTIIFVHSNSCPHCRDMVPILEKLESQGYQFYWAEGSNQDANKFVTDCFSDIMAGYVPQFICPKTREEHTGSMPESNLKQFADNCK